MAENTNVGQRLIWSIDVAKAFKHKQEDGTELDLQRVYQLVLPYGAPFDETYSVLADLLAEVKKLEQISKDQAAKLEAEKAAKEKQITTEEAAIN